MKPFYHSKKGGRFIDMGAQVEIKAKAAEQSHRQMTGAEMLVEVLRRESVEVLFGYPGGVVLPLYDVLYECEIPHILARHEQGSIHAAEGYARVTGKTGVVISTSGPGATNLVTGLADAMMDSLPIVAITGQVATSVIGSDAFQETSIIGVSTPVTKHNFQVRSVDQLPRIMKEAFHLASTGRKGPVLVDLPKDVILSVGEFDYDEEVSLPGYQPTTVPHILQIRKLLSAIQAAKKPVILAGAGVLHAGASCELLHFVEKTQIPVVNTLLGLGSIPGQHPLCLGMGGMHGGYTANMAMYEADLLINIGARFDDRLTGNLKHFAKHAVVVHIDIDPAEIGKNVETHIPIVGDAKSALQMLIDEADGSANTAEWLDRIRRMQSEFPFWYRQDDSTLKPQRVVEMVHELTYGDAIIVTDVGQHQMWAAQYYPFAKPGHFVTSGGLGTMGFGLPAAIGAKLGKPEKCICAILGDGGFQMTLEELAVLKDYHLPVKVLIFNNFALGMVRQWQELFYGERYSESLLPFQPDYVKLAQAYGMEGYCVKTESELLPVLKEAFANDEPVIVDCRITKEEKVFPMIPAGRGIHEMVGVQP
jgi:acetolactate synthase I/II/III large subunit